MNATATLKTAQDSVAKLEQAHALEPRSVSQDALDTARNAAAVAETNLKVVERQYDLTKAGAWSYDVTNQERQHEALVKAAAASSALLAEVHDPCADRRDRAVDRDGGRRATSRRKDRMAPTPKGSVRSSS